MVRGVGVCLRRRGVTLGGGGGGAAVVGGLGFWYSGKKDLGGGGLGISRGRASLSAIE